MSTPSISDDRTVRLAIEGMSCGHCVAAVTEALQAVPGVTVDRVAIGAATVVLPAGGASAADVVHAVREAGYEARVGRALPQAG